MVQIHTLQVDIQLPCHHLLKRVFSPNSIVLAHFIRNQETIEWTLNFILLISLANLMPVPDCFDYCTFVISFEVRVCESPNFVFHFQNYYHFQDHFHIQGVWGLLNFCMHFRIILPSFSKVALKILIMITS